MNGMDAGALAALGFFVLAGVIWVHSVPALITGGLLVLLAVIRIQMRINTRKPARHRPLRTERSRGGAEPSMTARSQWEQEALSRRIRQAGCPVCAAAAGKPCDPDLIGTTMVRPDGYRSFHLARALIAVPEAAPDYQEETDAEKAPASSG